MALTLNDNALAKLNTAFEYAQNAVQNERTGQDSVIRINGESFTCQVSHADAPKSGFGLFGFRRKDQQDLNNATRTLFKQTVLDALGLKDENELPKSVKDAMKLSDYHNKGRPLTARRIIAVVDAIRMLPSENAVNAAVGKCIERNAAAIEENANDPVPKLKVTSKMRADAISLVAKHGEGLGPKALQIVANYTLFTLANPYAAENADDVIGTLAKKLAKMDDFEYGDKRFTPLGNKLTEVYQDKLNFYMTPEHADAFEDNVSETLYKDASRAAFEINGSDPNAGIVSKDEQTKAVVSKFKEAVPEKFQKPLSMFMCQDMGRIMGELLNDRLTLQNNDPVLGSEYEGGDLMPFSPKDGELFDSMSGLVGKGQGIRYRLEVSDDKKSATITMEVNYDLRFRVEDVGYDGYNACGNVKYSEQFKFDLSGDELKMTSHLTSQKIEP
ncbi:MAG: hypothetical protein IJI36_09640 [Kiritimatiellae bacterium]|nr:hypothetical protein [Kiritimatiellia bacterium]